MRDWVLDIWSEVGLFHVEQCGIWKKVAGFVKKAERWGRIIPVLDLQAFPMDGMTVEAWRSAGFESLKVEPKIFEAVAQVIGS